MSVEPNLSVGFISFSDGLSSTIVRFMSGRYFPPRRDVMPMVAFGGTEAMN